MTSRILLSCIAILGMAAVVGMANLLTPQDNNDLVLERSDWAAIKIRDQAPPSVSEERPMTEASERTQLPVSEPLVSAIVAYVLGGQDTAKKWVESNSLETEEVRNLAAILDAERIGRRAILDERMSQAPDADRTLTREELSQFHASLRQFRQREIGVLKERDSQLRLALGTDRFTAFKKAAGPRLRTAEDYNDSRER